MRVSQVPYKTIQPPRWNNRVIIQQDQIITASKSKPLIIRRRKAAVLIVQNDPNMRMLRGNRRQIVRGRVCRMVVYNNQFIIGIGGIAENAFNTQRVSAKLLKVTMIMLAHGTACAIPAAICSYRAFHVFCCAISRHGGCPRGVCFGDRHIQLRDEFRLIVRKINQIAIRLDLR